MRWITSTLTLVLLAACASDGDEEGSPATGADVAADLSSLRTLHYDVEVLTATLGGTVAVGTSINAQGLVAGFANLAGNQSRHAVVWRDGIIQDLLTLGGANSNVQWPGLNDRGMVVGIAQTGTPDPLGEDWSCSAFFTGPEAVGATCLGFLWDNGVMHPLPTLGGNNGFATAVNNRGQVVGWAETAVADPTCDAPQVLQFRAVVWQPGRGKQRELAPYPGDSTSAATAINERGQVVGISGECDVAVGRFSAQRAVLWEHGRVRDIGNLGGIAWHTPMDINERGDVAGFSNPGAVPDETFQPHAFLWTSRGGITDLGLLEGHDFSQAFGINSRRQVVGRSCGATGCRAVIWHHGVLVDLNTRLGTGYPNTLTAARHVNEHGVITGNLVEASTGRTLAFVARPRR